jgi:hypothetical protein
MALSSSRVDLSKGASSTEKSGAAMMGDIGSTRSSPNLGSIKIVDPHPTKVPDRAQNLIFSAIVLDLAVAANGPGYVLSRSLSLRISRRYCSIRFWLSSKDSCGGRRPPLTGMRKTNPLNKIAIPQTTSAKPTEPI